MCCVLCVVWFRRRTCEETVELDQELEVDIVALWRLAVAALDVVVVEIWVDAAGLANIFFALTADGVLTNVIDLTVRFAGCAQSCEAGVVVGIQL